MLIFLSELLKNNPTMNDKFSELMNNTFKLQSNTILGTLSKTEKDKYDLIMTNPPYVTSGSSNYKDAIKNDGNLKDFYKTNGMGVESLFLEWIIRSLKPEHRALVIIPDGILNRLNDSRVRKLIKDECFIDAIISLPVNTFYTTPKKTYILIITKKLGDENQRQNRHQTDPVFTYLVSHIGETLDVKRFETPNENELPEVVSLFNQFKGAKASFKSDSKRCKIQPIDKFDPDSHWSVDRWWSKEEKIELGVEEEEVVLSLEEFKERLNDTLEEMNKIKKELDALK
jgi:type I restriction-modification system DNA methylase subunit